MEIKGREYPVKTFTYIANFVVELKGLDFTLSAVGISFSLVNVLIYLLNFIVTTDLVRQCNWISLWDRVPRR